MSPRTEEQSGAAREAPPRVFARRGYGAPGTISGLFTQ